jgi:hypothetical protein
MSDQPHEQQNSSARGEGAWREATDRIAARNDAARKAGKKQRQDYEGKREAARRTAERRVEADLLAKHARP